MPIALRGPVAVTNPRALVVARAGTNPGSEVSLGRKNRCRGAHFGHDLLCRIDSQTGYFREPLDLILMGAEQVGHLLIETAHLLLNQV